ncbi:transcriptional regulator, LacI family [Caldicellulosiruptor owensensis OL]|uniref:Transcriptional regulator, LacI family n=1 Tax=Caldicellulosiruptor owensensis (strain ATCC 700167 / DSM 13100 / OL) TaxID=632518 RepID=E4Q5R3_CALOW|nr:LacI family DNA-binding transcriptional regulator [Caldicellulosiruptor owensensis]ADQ05472.1 transcriptional regulator, LacI family [Caldicellulosiruptor owensensis OL]
MATIKDIAKKANVSPATVSYVLNNSAQISPETRERVLKAAQELNYQPNNLAKSLRKKKSMTIGVIAEDITVFSAPEIIDGINRYLEEKGYHIILNNLRLVKKVGNNYSKVIEHLEEIKKSIEVLLTRQVEGMIYIGFHMRDVAPFIKGIKIPIVCTYCYSSLGHISVNCDDYQGAYEVTKYLLENGHRKIGLITGPNDSLPSQERLKGFKDALSDFGVKLDNKLIRVGNWEYESGYENTMSILKENREVTAIFAMNDLMACGVMDAAKELGIKVPDQLSVVGFDDREFSYFHDPKLTTVKMPLDKMGEEAAKLILECISGDKLICTEDEKEIRNLKLKCTVIERESVKKIHYSSNNL